MAYYKDLREVVQSLEQRGKLYRYRDPISLLTELIPFHRVQMRGLPDEDRKTLLFENPVGKDGRRYNMSVLVGCYASSEQILYMGLGCETHLEALERFAQGMLHPVPPVVVNDGPVHEEVHTGEELKRLGLDEVPVPVEEVGFSGIIRTGLPILSQDPETGLINMGTYNGFLRARDRIAMGGGTGRTVMRVHWAKNRAKNQPQPVAIIVGADPAFMAASSAEIPYGKPGLDEITLAGGIAGRPVELVRGVTIPLNVPAHAEMVIEGYISPDPVVQPRLPFGEYAGYMIAEMSPAVMIDVTAITHRRNAMFTPVIVGYTPSDCNVVWGYVLCGLVYHHLKYELNLPVEDVYFPQESGATGICLIRVKDSASQDQVQQMLHAAAKFRVQKYVIAVNEDIELKEHESVFWALFTRTQPIDDVSVLDLGGMRGGGGHDPSRYPIASNYGKTLREAFITGEEHNSTVLINATRKFAFPPAALPAQEYMEHALKLWREREDLPMPRMRHPWHGYTLGYWPENLQEFARLMAQGDWLKVGEMTAKLQAKLSEVPERAGTLVERRST
jgi:4-hydroxy-3-polyprenylbenzoate decarboxylase